MKRFMISLTILAALLVVPTISQAQYKKGDGQAVLTFDVATITTAVAHNYPTSGTIDTRAYNAMTCEMSITAGDTRTFTPKCYAEAAGTNLTFTYPTTTVAASATGRYVWSPWGSAATADTNTVDSPHPLCRYIKVTSDAKGPGLISCTLRSF